MEKRFNFSKAAIESLPAPTGTAPDTYFDSKISHLAVRVQPSGKKTFFVLKRTNGQTKRITLGSASELSIENARSAAHEWLGKIADWKAKGYRGPSPLEKQPDGELTFQQGFKWYVDNALRPRAQSEGRDADAAETRRQELFDRYLTSLKTRRVADIEGAHMAALYARISREHGPIAANRALGLARTVFQSLVDANLAKSNPARIVKRYSEKNRKRTRFLQPTELVKFGQALAVEPNQDVRDFVELLLATGVRKGNAYSARWQDISFELSTWTIPRIRAKTNQPHTVHLTPKAASILQGRFARRAGNNEWVFPSKANPKKHVVDFKNQFYRLLDRAGIQSRKHDFTFHDLRRTAASYLAIAGCSLQTIGAFLGHQDLSSTQVYARLLETSVRESALRGEKTRERKRLEAVKKNPALLESAPVAVSA
jgi:integrase